jgi:hypothetical protein
MTTETYEERITNLVGRHLAPRSTGATIAPLLTALGGRRVSYEVKGWTFIRSDPPAEEFETLVRKTLLRALSSHIEMARMNFVDGVGVMDALLQKGRWKFAVAGEHERYDFAELIMHFSGVFYGERSQRDDTNTLKNAIEPALLSMLNEWMAPLTPLATYPSLSEITRLMFGDAWVSLVLDPAGANCDVWDLSLLVNEMRPRFSPGLIPGQMESVPEPLPLMDTP